MVQSVNYNSPYNTGYKTPYLHSFRGATSNIPAASAFQPKFTSQIPNDIVEVSAENSIKKKKGLTKGQKWAIGIGATVVGLPLLVMGLSKGMSGRISKLYKDKLILSELPEKLEFSDAKTVEEGIKYAKEVLKIKEVDSDFSLDAINYVNKMLVDVSNAHKGKLFMPTKLRYIENEKAIAYVNPHIMSKNFGELGINKLYFDDNYLTKKISEYLGLNKQKTAKTVKKEVEKFTDDKKFLTWCWDNKIVDLSNRFSNDSSSLTIKEKRDLLNNLDEGIDLIDSFENLSPFSSITRNLNIFKKYNIDVNLDEIKKLSLKEQQEKLKELLLKVKEKSGKPCVAKIDYTNIDTTVYHEMGHLQDFAKNLKELDIKDVKFDWKDAWKKADENVKNGKLFEHSERLQAVDNRWGGTTYEGYKELLEKNPQKFKERYPDLYNHLMDENIQQTAGKVSWYAQTSIGEFVAEVYAKLVSGAKLPDDVMALYKKYNGPMLAA